MAQLLLTVVAVEKVKKPGLHTDGGGQNLIVTNKQVKRWELRLTVEGKR